MGAASNYWQLLVLNLSNQARPRTIEAAQQYFQQQFPQAIEAQEVVDAPIQRKIFAELQPQQPHLPPTLCFRCSISHAIHQACLSIVLKFGRGSQFTQTFSLSDLLPWVLTDDGRDDLRFSEGDAARTVVDHRPISTEHPPLSFTILSSYAPDKASLSTWVNHHVTQHAEINRVLVEHGIFLITDWALLNDTSSTQLQKILAGMMYQLSTSEIEYSRQILQAYHAIYREDRLQKRLAGSGSSKARCQEPISEQLARMAAYLEATCDRSLSPEQILKQLKTIATQVRRYRIARKGGPTVMTSIDEPSIQVAAENTLIMDSDDDDDAQAAASFLETYRKDFLECINESIQSTIETEFQRLTKRHGGRPKEFIQGLYLFHCKGESMTEIAPQIGLEKQFQVSRLLKLDDLRTTIRQRSLMSLRDRVIQKVASQKIASFTSPEQLEILDQKLDVILDEQLEAIMQAASAESMAPRDKDKPKSPLKSLLARRICQYLDTRPQS